MPELDELVAGQVTALGEDFAVRRLSPWPTAGPAGPDPVGESWTACTGG